METEIVPFIRYESVKTHAYWSRAGIDTRLKIDEQNIATYKAHLQDCINYPTTGLLARKKYITGKPMNYPEAAIRNIRYLHRQPEIDVLQKNMENNLKVLYPKTKHIREYIIDNKRISLDGIEKIKKYTIFNKLKIALMKFI